MVTGEVNRARELLHPPQAVPLLACGGGHCSALEPHTGSIHHRLCKYLQGTSSVTFGATFPIGEGLPLLTQRIGARRLRASPCRVHSLTRRLCRGCAADMPPSANSNAASKKTAKQKDRREAVFLSMKHEVISIPTSSCLNRSAFGGDGRSLWPSRFRR